MFDFAYIKMLKVCVLLTMKHMNRKVDAMMKINYYKTFVFIYTSIFVGTKVI